MMVYELIYTSAPRGLQPGSRGFCTVAATADLPRALSSRLESLSGYRHVYPPHDERAELNPVVYSHLRATVDGQIYHVLSRIADAGLDYTKRSNKIAHHLALAAQDLGAAGPAWLLSQEGLWRSQWQGEPQWLPQPGRLPDDSCGADACPGWVELTGDANWATLLAEAAGERDALGVSLIFRPGMDTLGLVREALNLLPPQDRWKVTFSTYYTQLPPWVDCAWRFLLEGSPEATEARRAGRGLIVDLCRPTSAADELRRRQLARAGRAGPASPAGKTGPPARPPRPGSSGVWASRRHSQSEPLSMAISPPVPPPRRPASLRSRLATVGVCGAVMLAVAFLGFQILKGQSGRKLETSVANRPRPESSSAPKLPGDAESRAVPKKNGSENPSQPPERDRQPAADIAGVSPDLSKAENPPTGRPQEPGSPESPPVVNPDAASAQAEKPPEPPKPKTRPFAEMKQKAVDLKPPDAAVGGPGRGTAGKKEQPIGMILLDQPDQLEISLVGDVPGSGRNFEVTKPKLGTEGVWQWTVSCEGRSVPSREVGKFFLRKKPEPEASNRYGLSYLWTSSAPENEQLVNCRLGIKVSGDVEAEASSLELPLRVTPPEKKPLVLWPEEAGSCFTSVAVPLPRLPKTGPIRLDLYIDEFAEPIKFQFTFNRVSSQSVEPPKIAKRPFLAGNLEYVGVDPIATIKEPTIEVKLYLREWAGESPTATSLTRDDIRKFRRTLNLDTSDATRELNSLKNQIKDKEKNVNNLRKKLEDQKVTVADCKDKASLAPPKTRKGDSSPIENKLKAATEEQYKLDKMLKDAEDELAAITAGKARWEERMAACDLRAAAIARWEQIEASLRLTAIATVSVPRQSGSAAETYDVQLTNITFRPPSPPAPAAGAGPEPKP